MRPHKQAKIAAALWKHRLLTRNGNGIPAAILFIVKEKLTRKLARGIKQSARRAMPGHCSHPSTRGHHCAFSLRLPTRSHPLRRLCNGCNRWDYWVEPHRPRLLSLAGNIRSTRHRAALYRIRSALAWRRAALIQGKEDRARHLPPTLCPSLCILASDVV